MNHFLSHVLIIFMHHNNFNGKSLVYIDMMFHINVFVENILVKYFLMEAMGHQSPSLKLFTYYIQFYGQNEKLWDTVFIKLERSFPSLFFNPCARLKCSILWKICLHESCLLITLHEQAYLFTLDEFMIVHSILDDVSLYERYETRVSMVWRE